MAHTIAGPDPPEPTLAARSSAPTEPSTLPEPSTPAQARSWPARGGRTTALVAGGFFTATIALAILLVYLSSIQPMVYPADTPEGTFQRYYQAWIDRDFDAAYGYFSRAAQAQVSLPTYRRQAGDFYYEDSSQRILLDRTDARGDSADLELRIEHGGGGGPFTGGGYTEQWTVSLRSCPSTVRGRS